MIKWLFNLDRKNTEDLRDVDELVAYIEPESLHRKHRKKKSTIPAEKSPKKESTQQTPLTREVNTMKDHPKSFFTSMELPSNLQTSIEEKEGWSVVSSKKDKERIGKTRKQFSAIKEKHGIETKGNCVKVLQILASHNLNWEEVPREDSDMIIAIVSGSAKSLDTWCLFTLMWSCARLDINFFEVFSEETCNVLLNTLESAINKKQGYQTNSQGIASAVWGLTVFFFKYAKTQDQKQKLIKIIQNRLNRLKTIRVEDTHRLHFLRELLKEEKLTWPSIMFTILDTQELRLLDELTTSLEVDVYNALRRNYKDAYFKRDEKASKIINDYNVVLHQIDIVSKKYQVAIEVDGEEIHCYADSTKITTCTWLRNLLIKKMGYRLVCISNREWKTAVREGNTVELLDRKFKGCFFDKQFDRFSPHLFSSASETSKEEEPESSQDDSHQSSELS